MHESIIPAATTSGLTRFTPMSMGKILDRSFRSWPRLIGSIWGLIALNAAVGSFMSLSQPENPAVMIIVALFSIFLGALTIFVTPFIASDLWAGENPSFGRARERLTFSLFFAAIGLSIIIGIATMLWCLLLIIPGIIYALNRSVALYGLLLEGDGVFDALKRSKRLMTAKGSVSQKGRMLQLGIFSAVLSFAVTFVLGLLLGAVRHSGGGAGLAVAEPLLTFAINFSQTAVQALGVLATVGLYYDLRVRFEALDIETDLARLQTGNGKMQ